MESTNGRGATFGNETDGFFLSLKKIHRCNNKHLKI